MFRSILTSVALTILSMTKVFALDTIHPVLMERARTCPASVTGSVAALTHYLRKGLTNEHSQVEVFCYWIALNIGYDTKAYTQGTDPETSRILTTRKGVCQNYSELLTQMCSYAGIECYIVSGYSKGFDYKPGKKFQTTDHAWNVVKADGNYYLTDATWASGYVTYVNGSLKFVRELDLKHILANPDTFLETHLPGDPRWQLRHNPTSLIRFSTKEKVADMLNGMPATYYYKDSIANYVKSDSSSRIVLTAQSTYRFNPSLSNLNDLADAFYNQGWYYSNVLTDKAHLNASVQAYKTAIVYYTKLNSPTGQKWISASRQGIKYSEYLLSTTP